MNKWKKMKKIEKMKSIEKYWGEKIGLDFSVLFVKYLQYWFEIHHLIVLVHFDQYLE